jgi:hypothetical protein
MRPATTQRPHRFEDEGPGRPRSRDLPAAAQKTSIRTAGRADNYTVEAQGADHLARRVTPKRGDRETSGNISLFLAAS